MAKKRRKKRKNNASLFRKLLIVAVLVYIIIMSVPILRSSGAKTTPVTQANFVDSVDSKAVVIKDETVYKAQSQGKLKFSVKEGTKVSKDTLIAEMDNNGTENLKSQLEEVGLNIEEYKNGLSADRIAQKEDIDNLVSELNNNIQEENEEGINSSKEKLVALSEKPYEVDKLIGSINQRIELIKRSKDNSSVYTAEKSGIMSKSIDGYESKLTIDKLDSYKPKDVEIKEVKVKTIKDNQGVDKGSPIFKILEDQEWFIMAYIKDNNLGDKKVGDAVSLSIDSEEEKIEGNIYKLEKNNKDTFLIIKLDKYLHELYKKRSINLNITKDTFTGLEVPKEAIVDKDGKLGVYIKDISGVVKFREVRIVKNIKDKSIVEPSGETKALELFDEIFIDASKIKEGQIVNYKGGD